MAKFEEWAGSMTDQAFAQIVYLPTGTLNKSEIAKGSGVSVNALKTNAQVRASLKGLESRLRERGVLPPLTSLGKAKEKEPKRFDAGASKRALSERRLSSLEAENHDLRVKVAALENKLASYAETVEAIDELGIFKRCL